MTRVFLLALLVLSAGCLEASTSTTGGAKVQQEPGASPSPTAAPVVPGVDPSLPMGSIKGRLLNDEQLFIPNATVALVGYNVTAFTDAQGQFFFNDVNTGDYFIVARAAGYKEKQSGVQVREAEVSELTIILESLPKAVTHEETLIYKKSLNCRLILGHPLAPNGADATGAKRTCPLSTVLGSEYVGDYRQEVKPVLGLVGAIYEIKWSPATDASKRIELNVSLVPLNGAAGGFETRGTSPQFVEINKARFQQYLAAHPKSTNYEAAGGIIVFSIEVAPSVTGAPLDVGIAIEQNVDAIAHHYYVAEPADYGKEREYT